MIELASQDKYMQQMKIILDSYYENYINGPSIPSLKGHMWMDE